MKETRPSEDEYWLPAPTRRSSRLSSRFSAKEKPPNFTLFRQKIGEEAPKPIRRNGRRKKQGPETEIQLYLPLGPLGS
jgi:hypothetical protein